MDNIYIKKEDLYQYKGTYEVFNRLFENKDLISIDDLISCIEDLDSEVEDWKMKYEELQNDLEDNYRPISQAEQYEVSDRNFY